MLGLDLLKKAEQRRRETQAEQAAGAAAGVTFEGCEANEAVEKLALERVTAKKAKNFAEADRLRGEIAAMGYEVLDTPKGPVVKKA